MPSSRTLFIAFSVGAHAAVGLGIGAIDAKKSHAATAIQIANVKKPEKKPEPPKVDITPPPPEPKARERRAAAPKATEAEPPLEVAAPSAPAPLADTPDFGLSLSGGVDGTGIALPSGGSARGAPKAAPLTKALGSKRLTPAAATAALDPCEDPPAKPKYKSGPQPTYTDAARSAAIEGKVRVSLTVDETGKVIDVKLLQGLGYGLDEAALAAAKLQQFEPAVRCGKPARSTFNISLRFTL